MVILSSSSPTDIGVVIIILGQSTSNKIQRSISYTPEGTNTEGVRLTAAADRVNIIIANAARTRSTKLRRRPIAGGGGVPFGFTGISGIL